MKIIPVEQGSVEWHMARAGIPTASEFDKLLTPEFEIRKGDMPKSYLAKKVAEAWIGGPILGFSGFGMEQGQMLEPEARSRIAFEYEMEIDTVGFITTDDGRIGCSPDGLIGDDCGVEIKCPNIDTHVGYLLKGGLPKDYAAQVHGSMYVTGRKEWKFVSYRRRLPALVLTIERNEEIQEQINTALNNFLRAFDTAMARLEEINGGPPKRPCVPKTVTPQRANDFDLIP